MRPLPLLVFFITSLAMFFSLNPRANPVNVAIFVLVLALIGIVATASRDEKVHKQFAAWIGARGKRVDTSTRGQHLFALGFGIWLVSLTILALGLRQPFYFTQDDNHSSFLPIILQGCRGFFGGVFPTWNPYQYLGAPTTSMGLYSLTYPPIYLAYAIAKFGFRNEYMTLEVNAILHLLAAFTACYFFLRHLKIAAWDAMCGAFCYALSGYQLIAGRSWYYMLPVAVYTPLLFSQLLKLIHLKDLSARWILKTAFIIGLWYHAGNVQMWVYGMLLALAFCALLSLSGEMTKNKFFWIFPPLLVGSAIAMPLLVLQLVEAKDRTLPSGGYGVANGLANLFLPPPLVDSLYPGETSGEPRGALYFSGGVFTFFWSLATIITFGLILTKEKFLYYLRTQIFSFLALILLLFALSSHVGLWNLVAMIPPFDKFGMPFKLLGFLSFFGIVSGLLFLQQSFVRVKHGKWYRHSLTTLGLALTLLNCSQATYAFFTFADVPYPRLPEIYKPLSTFNGGKSRILPLGPDRSNGNSYTLNFMLNYPTVYGFLTLFGYDTTMARSPEFLELQEHFSLDRKLLGEYGVRWVVSEKKQLPRDIAALKPIPAAENDRFELHELPSVKPMVFDAQTSRAEAYKLRADGLDILLEPAREPRTIIANFLRRAWIRVFDEEGHELVAKPDPLHRIAISVPPNVDKIKVRYQLPWGRGLGIGFGMCLFAAVLYWQRRRLDQLFV